MKDPVTFFIALCLLAGGLVSLIRPDWIHDSAKPEKKKSTRLLGLALVAVGCALIYCCLYLA